MGDYYIITYLTIYFLIGLFEPSSYLNFIPRGCTFAQKKLPTTIDGRLKYAR